MPYGSSVKLASILCLCVISLLVASACAQKKLDAPEAVIEKFWAYCTKGEFDKARELICVEGSCIDPEKPVDDGSVVGVPKVSKVDENGKVTDSDSIVVRKNRDVLGFPIHGDIITDGKYEIKKITDIKTSKYAAQVLAAIDNKFNMKDTLVACLRKEKSSGDWKIYTLHTSSVFDYFKDPCLLETNP